MLLSSLFIKHYSLKTGGSIINLTSGQSVGPMPDELAYAATKGAIEAFTKSVAPVAMEKGITVNAASRTDEYRMDYRGAEASFSMEVPAR